MYTCTRRMVQASSCETQPAPDRPITVGTSVARLGYHDVIRKNHRTYYRYNLGFGDGWWCFLQIRFCHGIHGPFFFTSIWGKICYFLPTTQPSKSKSVNHSFFFQKKTSTEVCPDFCCQANPNPSIKQSNKSGRRWASANLGEKFDQMKCLHRP